MPPPELSTGGGWVAVIALLREAVEQAVAAGGDQIILAAGAGHMRRVPRPHLIAFVGAAPVDVPQHGLAEGAARVVVAGQVEVGRKRVAFRRRAGNGVMPVGRHAEAGHHLPTLGERGLQAELVAGAVEVVDILRDDLALEVLPRAFADAVAGIDRGDGGRLGAAEIGTPDLLAGAGGGPEGLASCVRGVNAAEIAALAG